MSSGALFAAAHLLLLAVLVSHFDLTKYEVKHHSKGFFPEATVQDFPTRGKNVYLHIAHCRWLNGNTGSIVTRILGLVAKGTRIISEFATFLKEVNK